MKTTRHRSHTSGTSADHDGVYKTFFGFEAVVLDLLELFFSTSLTQSIVPGSFERVETSFRAETLDERQGDMIWRARLDDQRELYLFILLEFQRSVDQRMALRVMNYVSQLSLMITAETGRARPGPLPVVLPIVLYNGKRPWTAATSVSDLLALDARSILWDFQVNSKYYLIDERRLDLHLFTTRHRDNLAALFFRTEQLQDSEAVIALLRDLVEALDPELHQLLQEAFIGLLVSGLKQLDDFQLPQPDELRELLGGTHMIEENMRAWQERLRREALTQGLEEGLEKGREEGREEGQLLIIDHLLRVRFGADPERRARLDSLPHHALLTLSELILLHPEWDEPRLMRELSLSSP